MAENNGRATARQARLVGGVIAATMLIWIGVQWLGKEAGITPRYMLLVDLFALAAFIWALVGVWQIWQRGRDN